MKTKTFISILLAVLCTLIFSFIFSYYIVIPKIIERRAMDLNLMQYNGDKDKFVAKDSSCISGWDVYYLQYGDMDGY